MGQAVSAAKNEAREAKDDLDALISILENKLEAFQLQVAAKRGLRTATGLDKEVVGGRTISRISDITVATSSGVAADLTTAINKFFEAATNETNGDSQGAKQSAIDGAQGLLTAGLDAIFGASSGQGKTKKSFVVLFLNNAFVRVDYFVYAFTVTGKKWGAEANKSGCCYLADIAVLDIKQLQPQEIDYLLSAALQIQPDEFQILAELKFELIQSAILGKALADQTLDFERLPQLAESYAKSQQKIDEVFSKLNPAGP